MLNRQKRHKVKNVLVAHKKHKQNNDNNMIPMINIVFLLLIFFMIAGQIKPITQADIEVPASTLKEDAIINTTRIAMNKENQLTLNGKSIDLETLEKNINSLSIKQSNITLIVDRRVIAANLNELLELFRLNGQTNITLLTTQKDDI